MFSQQQPKHPIIQIVLSNAPEQKPKETSDVRFERIKEFLQASNFADNTKKSYQKELEQFIVQVERTWHTVTPRDVSRYKDWLKLYRDSKGKPLSVSSINQALTAIKSFYAWFQLSGYLDFTTPLPTAAIKFEKLGVPLPRNLSKDQMNDIAVALAFDSDDPVSRRDRALLAVLIHGLRAEDVSQLNVENWDGERLSFCRKKTKEDARVPIRPSSRPAISEYLDWRRLEQREELQSISPLFLSHGHRTPGRRLGYQGIYHFVRFRLGRAIGVAPYSTDHLTPHRFRHTYACELLELGVDSLLARSLTGQSEKVFERYAKGVRLSSAEAAFLKAIGDD